MVINIIFIYSSYYSFMYDIYIYIYINDSYLYMMYDDLIAKN